MNMGEIGSKLKGIKASLMSLIGIILMVICMRFMRDIMVQETKQKDQR
jgi:hypothetical protein